MSKRFPVSKEMNSVLWANYGSFDEDAETGRWVAFAESRLLKRVGKNTGQFGTRWGPGKPPPEIRVQ